MDRYIHTTQTKVQSARKMKEWKRNEAWQYGGLVGMIKRVKEEEEERKKETKKIK